MGFLTGISGFLYLPQNMPIGTGLLQAENDLWIRLWFTMTLGEINIYTVYTQSHRDAYYVHLSQQLQKNASTEPLTLEKTLKGLLFVKAMLGYTH